MELRAQVREQPVLSGEGETGDPRVGSPAKRRPRRRGTARCGAHCRCPKFPAAFPLSSGRTVVEMVSCSLLFCLSLK